MSEDAYLDAILVFTPRAAKRLAEGCNRDPRSRNPGLNQSDVCGIYVSGKKHRKLEYTAQVSSVIETLGTGLLVEEVIGMLTFTPEEAMRYIKSDDTYYLISFKNVCKIEPIPLEDLKHDFNPMSGIKRYSGEERPLVRIL